MPEQAIKVQTITRYTIAMSVFRKFLRLRGVPVESRTVIDVRLFRGQFQVWVAEDESGPHERVSHEYWLTASSVEAFLKYPGNLADVTMGDDGICVSMATETRVRNYDA